MSRVSNIPTNELWGVEPELWYKSLEESGTKKCLIEYYALGIALMEASNKKLMDTIPYIDIVNTDTELLMKNRRSTIEFYRARLAELQ